jgi:hypothetical protein
MNEVMAMTERQRFCRAFDALLTENPDVPPGPTSLSRAMGLNSRQLNGRLSRLRINLLRRNGFYKDDRDGRWHKDGRETQ